MKLSKTQQEVVALMREGWELGRSTTMGGRTWLQNGGIGRGGEVKRVSAATATALSRAGVIVSNGYNFPVETFRLKESRP